MTSETNTDEEVLPLIVSLIALRLERLRSCEMTFLLANIGAYGPELATSPGWVVAAAWAAFHRLQAS